MSHIVDTIVSEGLADTKSFRTQATVQATTASTITLTTSSEMLQVFTGTTAGQIVRLPAANTGLLIGHRYEIWNLSTVTIAINNTGSVTQLTLLSQRSATFILQDNTTANGVWSYIQADVIPGRQSNSVTPPFIFSYNGGAGVGTYLRTGSVPTNTTGQRIKGTNTVLEIDVSASANVTATTTIQFQRRTAVSTFSNITGATVTLSAGQYTASNTGLSIPIGPDWEVSCYVSVGSLTNPVVVIYPVPA